MLNVHPALLRCHFFGNRDFVVAVDVYLTMIALFYKQAQPAKIGASVLAYVQAHFGEEEAQALQETARELDQARARLCNHRDAPDIVDVAQHYVGRLDQMAAHFTFLPPQKSSLLGRRKKPEGVHINFTWHDAFQRQRIAQSHSPVLEK
ncbi:MAG: hypothetical protein MHM6MM_008657, partial [Cercozoa sp. M6MM]